MKEQLEVFKKSIAKKDADISYYQDCKVLKLEAKYAFGLFPIFMFAFGTAKILGLSQNAGEYAFIFSGSALFMQYMKSLNKLYKDRPKEREEIITRYIRNSLSRFDQEWRDKEYIHEDADKPYFMRDK